MALNSPNPVTDLSNMTIKQRAAKWLFDQGTSTVLLTAILGALCFGAYKWIPYMVEKQATELQQTRTDYHTYLTEQRTDFINALKEMKPPQRGN